MHCASKLDLVFLSPKSCMHQFHNIFHDILIAVIGTGSSSLKNTDYTVYKHNLRLTLIHLMVWWVPIDLAHYQKYKPCPFENIVKYPCFL